MAEEYKELLYSPISLTEDGVFEVACDGRKFITKKNGVLTLIDTISFAVIEEFGTYSEAKNIKFSPNSKYICFIDTKHPMTVKVIDLDSKLTYIVEIDQNFSIEYITWSINSEFVVFVSELNVYVGVYRIGKEKIILEGTSSDEFNRPLIIFNPNIDYFSVIRHDLLFSYCTDTWEIHSVIKCPTNPIGLIYSDPYTVAVWTSSGKFVVLSLLGKNKFERTGTFSSRLKSARLCQEHRVLVVATYDDKIELFDVFSWERLYFFEYPVELNVSNSVIWSEVTGNLQFAGGQLFTDHRFDRKPSLSLHNNNNMCDEFKIKTTCKFMLSLSNENRLLASYSPGFPNVVWIRSLKNGKLVGVISTKETAIQGLRWHPTREKLAILTLDSVIFWMESKTVAIYCKYIMTSFHWVNTKLTICGIATKREYVFVYFKK